MRRCPLVSIIIPVYNVEKYVSECIQSAIDQTYSNIEVLIINDGSTDSSFEICKQFVSLDKRIVLFDKENGGLSDARNYGIDRMTGDYVYFLDSDDYIAKTCIERLLRLAIKTNSDISCGGYVRFDDNKYYGEKKAQRTSVFDTHEAMREMVCENEISTMACNKLYSAALFQTIRFPVQKLHEDIFVMHRIIDKAKQVAVLDKVTYFYRFNPRSISKGEFTKKKQDAVVAEKKRLDFIKLKYPDLEGFQIKMYVWHCVSINYMILCSGICKYKKMYRYNCNQIKKYWKVFHDSDASIKAKTMAFLELVVDLIV